MSRQAAEVRYLGICHHSPLASKSLLLVLNRFDPELVLVEGPPEAEPLLPWIGHAELVPPVAILTHAPAHPRRSLLYPLVEYSPEWQALLWAGRHHRQAALIDWPHRYRLAAQVSADEMNPSSPATVTLDGFETCEPSEQYFDAIDQVVNEARGNRDPTALDYRRETWMRYLIAKHCKRTPGRVAVVVGAWHLPELREAASRPGPSPRVRVRCQWVPLTYDALRQPGYTAGVSDPHWCEHVWRTTAMTRTPLWFLHHARERSPSLDAVMSATRVAESLAALRGAQQPGPNELIESWATVCSQPRPEDGFEDHLGSIPAALTPTPLVDDFQWCMQQAGLTKLVKVRRLALRTDALRDRPRSQLFHVSVLLGLPWAQLGHHVTYPGRRHEQWEYRWSSDVVPQLVQLSSLATTCTMAAERIVLKQLRSGTDAPTLATLLMHVFGAGLKNLVTAIADLIRRRQPRYNLAELLLLASSVAQVALGHRQERSTLQSCVLGLLRAARQRASQRDRLEPAIPTLIEAHAVLIQLPRAVDQEWIRFLQTLAKKGSAGGAAAGSACRLLMELNHYPGDLDKLIPTMSGQSHGETILAWWSGFLRGSLAPLLAFSTWRRALSQWVTGLTEEQFQAWLPLLRHAFAAAPLAHRVHLLELLEGQRD
jgi:hypothetical protein